MHHTVFLLVKTRLSNNERFPHLSGSGWLGYNMKALTKIQVCVCVIAAIASSTPECVRWWEYCNSHLDACRIKPSI